MFLENCLPALTGYMIDTRDKKGNEKSWVFGYKDKDKDRKGLQSARHYLVRLKLPHLGKVSVSWKILKL